MIAWFQILEIGMFSPVFSKGSYFISGFSEIIPGVSIFIYLFISDVINFDLWDAHMERGSFTSTGHVGISTFGYSWFQIPNWDSKFGWYQGG